jgi:site-specific DNA-methyltransferase (adenine-specific)
VAQLFWEGKKACPDSLKVSNFESQYVHSKPYYGNGQLELPMDRTELRGKPLNRIIQGDNLQAAANLINQGYKEKIQLIYIDPPYFSQKGYSTKKGINSRLSINRTAFNDIWNHGIDSYLEMIYPRLCIFKELLSHTGSMFVHLDWHVSHYVKLLLDELFGQKNFINEIVWCYTGGSNAKRHFQRKHDIILWYGKTQDYCFIPQYRPYSQGTVDRGLTRVKGNKYRLRQEGAIMPDWWTDINKILSPTARENLKYPTQKPARLLERIISCASLPGDTVADFFVGSGTTAYVCQQLGRNWLVCDNSPIAIQTTIKRLLKIDGCSFQVHRAGDREPYKSRVVLKPPEIHPYNHELNLVFLHIEDYCWSKNRKVELGGNEIGTVLIDYWEIDFDYHGQFHSDLQVINEDHNNPIISLTALVPRKKSYSIAVQVYDIFGDSAFAVHEVCI